MKLAFVYYPVKDLPGALEFYRDVLGLEVAWRMGEAIGLNIPDSQAGVLIDSYEPNGPRRAGAVFEVDSVDAFWEEHHTRLRFVQEPMDVPGGRWAIFLDPSGNEVRITDESRPV